MKKHIVLIGLSTAVILANSNGILENVKKTAVDSAKVVQETTKEAMDKAGDILSKGVQEMNNAVEEMQSENKNKKALDKLKSIGIQDIKPVKTKENNSSEANTSEKKWDEVNAQHTFHQTNITHQEAVDTKMKEKNIEYMQPVVTEEMERKAELKANREEKVILALSKLIEKVKVIEKDIKEIKDEKIKPTLDKLKKEVAEITKKVKITVLDAAEKTKEVVVKANALAADSDVKKGSKAKEPIKNKKCSHYFESSFEQPNEYTIKNETYIYKEPVDKKSNRVEFLQKGTKVIADKFNSSGWIHVDKGWIKGFKVDPAFKTICK